MSFKKTITAGQTIMISQTLRKTPMFSDIDSPTLEKLARGCYLKKVSKGNYLFHEGETVQGFFVVHSGAVNIHRVTEEGREQVIRVFYPGESFGEVILIGDNSYPASAKVVEESRVILVPAEFFRAEIQRDPNLSLRILSSMSMHLRYLIETIESLKLSQAESRVVQWLLRQLEDNGNLNNPTPDFTLPLPKHLLASQLGITSETLSRVFAHLRKLDLITMEGKTVHFHSVSKLKDYLLETERLN